MYELIRSAWRMYQSEDETETWVAVALVAFMVGPAVWRRLRD